MSTKRAMSLWHIDTHEKKHRLPSDPTFSYQPNKKEFNEITIQKLSFLGFFWGVFTGWFLLGVFHLFQGLVGKFLHPGRDPP